MKIGFIGTGNMAKAIIQGILDKEYLSADQIFITGHTKKNVHELAEKTGVCKVENAVDLLEKVNMVVVAVKPYAFSTVLASIQKELKERKTLVVSIAAGLTLDDLAKMTSPEQKIIRVMPNINATIGESMTAICKNTYATEKEAIIVADLFGVVGKTMQIEENHFSIFAAIAGSSPAFAYLFIDSIARAALKAGMPKNQAIEITAQAVLGSAKMILESKEHPFALADKVASPGGTTIAGIATLEDNKFISTVMKSITATIEHDQKLQQQLK